MFIHLFPGPGHYKSLPAGHMEKKGPQNGGKLNESEHPLLSSGTSYMIRQLFAMGSQCSSFLIFLIVNGAEPS
ncbi:MAG TPA: hypothetical protein DCO79_00765 [Spirochaeta sp.]|nr:hypothetical protein [Spirochaeta sp.]